MELKLSDLIHDEITNVSEVLHCLADNTDDGRLKQLAEDAVAACRRVRLLSAQAKVTDQHTKVGWK